MIAPEIKRATRTFYALTTMWSAFFPAINWLVYWQLFFSNKGIGIVDAIGYLLGMMAEVPTGAIADRIGRRPMMMLGTAIMGLGYVAQGLAHNGAMLFAGFVGYTVGSSFYSGADDAYMFDYLKSRGADGMWETIARRKTLVRRIGNTGAIFLGGYLYVWNVRLPSLARGVLFLVMLWPLVAMRFMDGGQPRRVKAAAGGYWRHIWTGMRELLNRRMLPTVLIVLWVQGVTVTVFIGGILRPLMLERSGLAAVNQSTFVALASVPIVLLLSRPVRRRKWPPFGRAVAWAVVIIVGFALNLPAHSLVTALIGLTLIQFGAYLLLPATSTLVNESASSEHRATAISTANLLEDLAYVLTAPFIGLAADKDELTLVIAIITAVMALAVGTAVVVQRASRRPQIVGS